MNNHISQACPEDGSNIYLREINKHCHIYTVQRYKSEWTSKKITVKNWMIVSNFKALSQVFQKDLRRTIEITSG
jgi:hypothetical protein